MEKSTVSIKINHPESGKVKKTITDHNDLAELLEQIQIMQESEEVIKAGENLSVTCSSCCNNLKLTDCFKAKTKVDAKDNKVSVV